MSKRRNAFYASLLVPSFSCSFSLFSLSILALFPGTVCHHLADLALGLTQRFWVVCIHPKLWAGGDHPRPWLIGQSSWTPHSPEGDPHIRGAHGTVCQLRFFNHGPNELPLRASSFLNSQKNWGKKVKEICCVIKSSSLSSQAVAHRTLIWNTSNTHWQTAGFLPPFPYSKSYSTHSHNTSLSVRSTCDILYPGTTVLLMLLNLNSFSLSCIFIPFPFYSEDAIAFAFWFTEFPPSSIPRRKHNRHNCKIYIFLKPYIPP